MKLLNLNISNKLCLFPYLLQVTIFTTINIQYEKNYKICYTLKKIANKIS